MRVTHNLIRDTAKEMAAAWYDDAASHSNKFYKAYPSQLAFVNRHWSNFVKQAREALVSLLAKPGFPEEMKEQIADAIFAERTLPAGGGRHIRTIDRVFH